MIALWASYIKEQMRRIFVWCLLFFFVIKISIYIS